MSMIKTPKFWYKEKAGLTSFLLSPFSKIYENAAHQNAAKQKERSYTSNIPVICVGNLTAGGSGKTPTSLALYDLILKSQIAIQPAFLTRGHGGSVTGPEKVRQDGTSQMWGDESLLLAKKGLTIKSHDRRKGAELIESLNADCIIMDDGAQNHALSKNITFIVINGSKGFGNKRVLPAGPLRTPLSQGYELADAFILIGEDKRNISGELPEDKPLFKAQIDTKDKWAKDSLKPYIAFAGIAFPENFKKTLLDNNLQIKEFVPFPDHHDYSKKDLKLLRAMAEKHNATLITTEKDYVRLPEGFSKARIETLPVELQFADEDKLTEFIKERLQR